MLMLLKLCFANKQGPLIPPRHLGGYVGRRAAFFLIAAALLLPSSGLVAQNLIVTNNLQLWLKADAGVTTNATGAVTAWADQSGKNNNAVQADEALAPALVSGALNGKPALQFDGNDDYLDVATSPSIEIQGDISSFFVVKFDDFANYRAVWGKTVNNAPASTDYYITPEGIPRVYRGSGDLSDIGSADSTARPRAGNHVLLGFEMEGTTLTHYLNEKAVGGGEITATLVDGGTPLKIGSRDDLFTKMKGQIAELVIYDKALSDIERSNVVAYLQTKYGITNQAPTITLTSPANNTAVTAPAVVTITANAADPDGSVSKVDFFANGALLATATASPFKVPVVVQTGGTIVLTAVATDSKDATTTSAPITITATGGPATSLTATNGLQLWLKADAGVTKDASGAVTAWADQSGKGNNAVQPDVTMAPLFSATGFAGQPSLHFDGTDDFLNVASSPSIAITGDIASFFAVRFDDFATYRSVWGKTAGNVPRPTDYYLLPSSGLPRVFRGSADTSVNQFVDAAGGVPTNTPALLGFTQTGTLMTHYFNGQPFGSGQMTVVPTDSESDLKIGTRDDFVTRMSGDIAELLLFDRGLTPAEASTVSIYMAGKYGVALAQASNNPPSVTLSGPAAGTSFPVPTNVTVTATAQDPDGGIARVDFYADGALVGTSSTAPYSAKVNLLLGGTVALTAVATDNLGARATSPPVSITAQSATTVPLPATAALKLWLKADAGVAADASGAVTNWTDFSGNGNAATQGDPAQAPQLVTNAVQQLPALRFDGDNDFLQVASSPSLVMPADLTTFFVISIDDYATFRAIWAKTEGNQPRPTDYYLLPDTGIPRAIHGGTAGNGSVDATEPVPLNAFVVVGYELAGTTLTHYFGNRAVGAGPISAAGTDAGTPLLIGTRGDGGTRLKGSLAELIIYGGALSDADRTTVVNYLESKYLGVNGGLRLSFERTATGFVLTWTGTATLEEAPAITGPWTTVPVTGNSYPVTASGAQKLLSLAAVKCGAAASSSKHRRGQRAAVRCKSRARYQRVLLRFCLRQLTVEDPDLQETLIARKAAFRLVRTDLKPAVRSVATDGRLIFHGPVRKQPRR